MKRQRPAPHTLKQYRVKVKHDHGAQVIRTAAENEAAAIAQLMIVEGCPRSAIVWCKECH